MVGRRRSIWINALIQWTVCWCKVMLCAGILEFELHTCKNLNNFLPISFPVFPPTIELRAFTNAVKSCCTLGDKSWQISCAWIAQCKQTTIGLSFWISSLDQRLFSQSEEFVWRYANVPTGSVLALSLHTSLVMNRIPVKLLTEFDLGFEDQNSGFHQKSMGC